MKRTAFIIRGLSGSGKSTIARMIKTFIENDEIKRENSCKIISTDDFFMEAGVYKFDPKLLGKNHALAFEAFVDALKPESNYRAVILDNTNTQYWEYKEYIKVAKEANWDIQVMIIGQPKDDEHVLQCAERNSHGVPLEAIMRMSNRFQL